MASMAFCRMGSSILAKLNDRARRTPIRAPFSPSGLEEFPVILEKPDAGRLRRRVVRIGPGHRAEERRRVGDRPGHRPGGVLRVGDRDDPRAADEPHRRLEADEAAAGGGRDDRAVGLRADARGGEIGRYRRRRPRARPRRVPVERVGIPRLAAPAAPAARRPRRAEVRPLAEVRLGQDDGAGLAETLDDERVLGRLRAEEGERSGRRLHPVGRVDVVLDDDGDAVEGPPRSLLLALPVELAGDGQGVGIRLDDRR